MSKYTYGKTNTFIRATVEHLPSALIAHGIFKMGEKIVEAHRNDKSNQNNKYKPQNDRFKP